MAGLARIDASALLAAGIIYRDSTLTPLHEHHERRYPDDQQDKEQGNGRVHFTRVDQLEGTADGCRQAGDDAGQDDHRDTVTDAALGDLLPEPHEEDCPRDQGDHRRKDEAEAGVDHEPLILQRIRSTERLHQGEANGAVARVLGQFAASGLAFLPQLIHLRNDDTGHLHDD